MELVDSTMVECTIGDFSVEDGLATPRVMAANTEHMLVFAEGSADLGEVTLEVKLTPKPRTTTLNVSAPIRVGGTFLEPTFVPDALSTLRRLGGLAGAVVFPPAALLAFGGLGSSADPCIEDIGTRSKAGLAVESSCPSDAAGDVASNPGGWPADRESPR